MTTPAFQIMAGGIDVTGNLNDRLLELALQLHDGHQSDQLSIRVDDRDFAVRAPETGTELVLLLGYRESGLVFQGTYQVDKVSVSGPPLSMLITAKAADQRGAQKQPRSRAYEKKTLGQILEAIAKRHGLKTSISQSLKSIDYPYLHQSEESDWHLGTRLARNHDALFAIKNKTLIFKKRGEAGEMPKLFLSRGDLLHYEASSGDRPRHKKALVGWHDRGSSKVKLESTDSDKKSKATYTMRHLFPTERLAKEASKAKANELQRAQGSVEVTIIGDPTVQPNGDMVVSAGRTILDGVWAMKTVTHRLNDSNGYRTTIHGEAKPDESKRGGSGSGASGGGRPPGVTTGGSSEPG